MREVKKKRRDSLRPDPEQPRKSYDESELMALAESMKRHGQQVPLIIYDNFILDGHRRHRAAALGNIDFLDVIELESRPTESVLRILQLTNDIHRVSLSAVERSECLARIMRENNFSVSELADSVSMKQPQVSKLLKIHAAACPELRAALHSGSVDQDKAYTICQEPDHAKQRELLKQSGDLTREQLRQKARAGEQAVDVKAGIARFPLPKGITVTVQGPKMNLAGTIDAMLETIKELRKLQSQQFDVTTAMRAMRDRAKSIS